MGLYVLYLIFTLNAQDDITAERLKEKFVAAIQRYLPSIQKDQLSPAYTGIRPKLLGSADKFQVCQLCPEKSYVRIS